MPKPSVPLVAHGVPAPVKARAIQCAHEVLPLVPVRPITRIFRLGTPYHWRAMKPARSGKSDASKLGTVHAGAACSEAGCQITAAAPRAIASSIYGRLSAPCTAYARYAAPGWIARLSACRLAALDTCWLSHRSEERRVGKECRS